MTGPRISRVEDVDDPAVAELSKLTDAAARRATDAAHGCFVAEGMLVLRAVVEAGLRVRTLLVADSKLDRVLRLLDATMVDATMVDATVVDATVVDATMVDATPGGTVDCVHVATRAVLDEVVGFRMHRGVVASVDRPEPASLEAVARHAGPVLVVEAVTDTENIGALFRNAAAFGAAVVLTPDAADPLYRRAVRVSLGHVLRVPWCRAERQALSGVLDRAGRTLVALTGSGARVLTDLTEAPGSVAFLVGTEGDGLSAAMLAVSDTAVRIDISPDVDSLNVATAAAVALHHVVTTPQRGS